MTEQLTKDEILPAIHAGISSSSERREGGSLAPMNASDAETSDREGRGAGRGRDTSARTGGGNSLQGHAGRGAARFKPSTWAWVFGNYGRGCSSSQRCPLSHVILDQKKRRLHCTDGIQFGLEGGSGL